MKVIPHIIAIQRIGIRRRDSIFSSVHRVLTASRSKARHPG
jgi:hypothetical protein